MNNQLNNLSKREVEEKNDVEDGDKVIDGVPKVSEDYISNMFNLFNNKINTTTSNENQDYVRPTYGS